MFAAAEFFRVINENSIPTCEVYRDWAFCLIAFASLYEGIAIPRILPLNLQELRNSMNC